MEVTLKELEIAIRDCDRRYANFFNTFGFLVIRNAIPSGDFKNLLREYDEQYTDRLEPISILGMLRNRLGPKEHRKVGFKKILINILVRPGMRFLPNFVDSSDKFTNYFLGGRFDKIYEYFAGENWLYLGSDGSNFVTTSFP